MPGKEKGFDLALFSSIKNILDSFQLITEYAEKDFFTHEITDLTQIEHFNQLIQKRLNDGMFKIDPGKENSTQLAELYKMLEVIRESLMQVVYAVQTKVNENVRFSEKAIEEIRFLFTELKELLRNTLDYLATGNKILAKWLQEKSKEYEAVFKRFAKEHEERLSEGICAPHSSTIYLFLFNNFYNIFWKLGSTPEFFGNLNVIWI